LGYFGEAFTPPCHHCDYCDAHPDGLPAVHDADTPFSVGEHVDHPEFGTGTIQRVDDGIITVIFDRVGYKTLSAEIVTRRHLL
ncbi:MAG: ATP-dependent helicase, RecQ family, partial [Conexibacter sp.]|nr:ATP-dependent helicase, RecQ family [Conexibacter sp.]